MKKKVVNENNQYLIYLWVRRLAGAVIILSIVQIFLITIIIKLGVLK